MPRAVPGLTPGPMRSASRRPFAILSFVLLALTTLTGVTWARRRAEAREAARLMAPGDTVAVYGPHRFTSNGSSSTTGLEHFTLSPQPNRRYLLRLENGNADGSSRATSGTVSLNGAAILSIADLAGQR